MKAIAIIPKSPGSVLVERPEPSILHEDDIKVRIIRVGICGTDREEVAGGRAMPPIGQNELVIGHEMFGQVVETGSTISRVKAGDFAVFTVRRGCGQCIPCQIHRPDMCQTGKYLERGIWGLDGYQTEFVVDKEENIVQVPDELESVGVLAEPMSVAEKAIDEIVRLQLARLADAPANPNWLASRRCLVAGLGPIGLLAAVALRLRGAEVYGLDIVDEKSARPLWLEHIGGHYVDGRKVPVDQIEKTLGPMSLIFEAAGIPGLAFNLFDALSNNGGYVLTGVPSDIRPLQIPAGVILRNLVLDNQLMVGSVNASRDHFQMAISDLRLAQLLWGPHLAELITNHYKAQNRGEPLMRHSPDEIKAVIEWT